MGAGYQRMLPRLDDLNRFYWTSGEVFSYTVNEKAWGPGLEVPYVIGVVRLDEQDGLQLTTNICGIASDQVHIGMRVRVTFDHDEDIWLPMFEPEAIRNAA